MIAARRHDSKQAIGKIKCNICALSKDDAMARIYGCEDPATATCGSIPVRLSKPNPPVDIARCPTAWLLDQPAIWAWVDFLHVAYDLRETSNLVCLGAMTPKAVELLGVFANEMAAIASDRKQV